MAIVQSVMENLIMPTLAGIAIYLICKWIDKRLK